MRACERWGRGVGGTADVSTCGMRDAPGRVILLGALEFGIGCIGLIAPPRRALEKGESRQL